MSSSSLNNPGSKDDDPGLKLGNNSTAKLSNPILSKSPNNMSCNSHLNSNACKVLNSNSKVKASQNHTQRRKIKQKDIVILRSNIRGWQSKCEALSNIAKSKKPEIIILTETHCIGQKAPKVKGYTTYFENRKERMKGGVAILITDFSVSLSSFEPPLVVMAWFGIIENQFLNQELIKIQSELFNSYENHLSSGSTVLLAGDFNNHVGNNLGLTKNNPKESKGGKNLTNWAESNNLFLINTLDQSHTHFDRSSKKGDTSILDLSIINDRALVKHFEVDAKVDFTPYRIRKVKGGRVRVHSDHVSTLLTLSPVWKEKPFTNKVTLWNFSKAGGEEAYKNLTDEFAAEFDAKMDEDAMNIDELYEWYLGKIDAIKMKAYGKTTSTISRAKKIEDSKIWHKRIKEVSKSISSLGKKKICNKVWELRKKTSEKYSDKQFVSIKHHETGVLTRTREETNEVLLSYNLILLQKDKVIKTEEILQDDVIQDIIIKCGMEEEELEKDKEFTWEEFTEVMTKVKLSNKSVYRDLVKAGKIFHLLYLRFLNRIYTREQLPKAFNKTTLMKLFKNKGSRNELKFNRFIHLKDNSPKYYERMVMKKMESRHNSHNTPSFQIGGKKASSTTEHLTTLMIYMRLLEKVKGAGVCQFLDIKTYTKESKLMGDTITNALAKLKMEAHPDKSCLICTFWQERCERKVKSRNRMFANKDSRVQDEFQRM